MLLKCYKPSFPLYFGTREEFSYLFANCLMYVPGVMHILLNASSSSLPMGDSHVPNSRRKRQHTGEAAACRTRVQAASGKAGETSWKQIDAERVDALSFQLSKSVTMK